MDLLRIFDHTPRLADFYVDAVVGRFLPGPELMLLSHCFSSFSFFV
jgi:hypothetical protein